MHDARRECVILGRLASQHILGFQHFNNYKAAAATKLAALPNPRLDSMEKESRIDVKSWMWEHTRDVHGGVVGQN